LGGKRSVEEGWVGKGKERRLTRSGSSRSGLLLLGSLSLRLGLLHVGGPVVTKRKETEETKVSFQSIEDERNEESERRGKRTRGSSYHEATA